MKRLAAFLIIGAAPAAAIPPALPPPDQFDFTVDGVTIACRLPDPGGPLVGCMMQDSLYLLSAMVHRRADGSYYYSLSRNCLEPVPATQGYEFAYASGAIPVGQTLRGTSFEADLRRLAAMRIKPECETLANWPHQVEQILPRLERAFAVYRTLRFK